ncbi:rod shape-determining protein RodA [bacterium]|nr:rod shape-determining protein RodA [bacterium]
MRAISDFGIANPQSPVGVAMERERMFDLRLLKKADPLVVVVMVTLIAAGVTVIFTAAGRGVAQRQIIWACVGLLIFVAAACFPYKKISLLAYPFYGAALFALVLVLVVGQIRHGGKRWIEIAGFTFQPSEFAKLATIFALAKFLAQSRFPRESWKYIFVPIGLIIPPMALIYLQPNLGTALAMLPMAFGMLYLAEASVKKLAVLVAIGCLALPPLWLEMRTYQKKRVLEFLPPGQRKLMLRFMTVKEKQELRRKLDPSGKQDLATLLSTMAEGWNSEQAMIAVGSGGIFGNGWGGGEQTRLGFLPEAHTDFVFPVFCEQWGFAGSIIIIFLYWLLIWSGFRIAGGAADGLGRLVASGISILIAWHVVVNTLMCLGLLPITGLPLPLMSYGGSSIVMTMMSLGVLEAIHARKFYPLSWRYSL